MKTENNCEHDWHWKYDCFEDAVIIELDAIGIPVECSICNAKGIEWWVYGRVDEL